MWLGVPILFFNVASVLSSAAISLVPRVYSLLLFPLIAKSVAEKGGNPVYKVNESIRYLFMLGVMVAAPSLISSMGLNGAVLAFITMSVFLTIVLIFIARRFLKINPGMKKIFLVLLSALVSGVISFELVDYLDGLLKVFVGFVVFGIFYVATLLFFNAFSEDDYDILMDLLNKRGSFTKAIFLFVINSRIKF